MTSAEVVLPVRTSVVTLPYMFNRAEIEDQETLLQAFDRLFDRAAAKLNIRYTAEEREQARRSFASRFREAIELVEREERSSVTDRELREMEAAIDELSEANIAGYLAAGPLAIHLQKTMRALAVKAAEQRLLEHLISQTDDTYGGN